MARAERELAENAPGPREYRLHLDLARRYETQITHLIRDGDRAGARPDRQD
jgi:hypothetical protein